MVTRSSNAQNVTYELHDNSTFFLTGHKVLLGSEQDHLLKYAKYHYNGKIKLLYFSSQYSSLASLKSRLSENTFIHIIVNIFSVINAVKSNGFLDPSNIDVSSETIFVDRITLEVYLTYLPVMNRNVGDKTAQFQNELCANLIGMINELPALDTKIMRRVATALSNTSTDFQTLLGVFRSLLNQDGESIAPSGELPTQAGGKPAMRLTAQGMSGGLVFTVNKPEYLIGKSTDADGAIPGNRAISRKHCKIVRQGAAFYAIDLGSSNGTYVNGKRLAKDTQAKLENGGVLRIADIEFKVTIG